MKITNNVREDMQQERNGDHKAPTREMLARHEAGHAIVANYLGYTVVEVDLDARGTQWHRVKKNGGFSSPQDDVYIGLGGPVAMMMRDANGQSGGGSDFLAIARIMVESLDNPGDLPAMLYAVTRCAFAVQAILASEREEHERFTKALLKSPRIAYPFMNGKANYAR